MPSSEARVSESDHPSATAATATIATSGISSATPPVGRRPPSFRRGLVRPWDGMVFVSPRDAGTQPAVPNVTVMFDADH
jgi:hypothetical protein